MNSTFLKILNGALVVYLAFLLPLLSTVHQLHHQEEEHHHMESEKDFHSGDIAAKASLHSQHQHSLDHNCDLCLFHSSQNKRIFDKKPTHVLSTAPLEIASHFSPWNPPTLLYFSKLPSRAPPIA